MHHPFKLENLGSNPSGFTMYFVIMIPKENNSVQSKRYVYPHDEIEYAKADYKARKDFYGKTYHVYLACKSKE